MFAVLAQKTGVKEMTLDLPAGACVSDAMAQIEALHPAVASMHAGLSIAVNLSYVPRGQELRDGDELALIPPVSGG